MKRKLLWSAAACCRFLPPELAPAHFRNPFSFFNLLLIQRLHRFFHCNKLETEVAPAWQPVLQRGERSRAVIVLLPVIAIMKAQDIPRAALTL